MSGKAPGPDGFPIEFFKKCTHKLSPLLKEVYCEALELKSLPPTMTQAKCERTASLHLLLPFSHGSSALRRLNTQGRQQGAPICTFKHYIYIYI